MDKQKRGLILGATALLLTTVTVTGVGLRLARSQAFFQDNPKEVVDEVWQIVNRTYVDGTFNQVDWRSVRKDYLGRTYKNPEEAYKAIREMLKKLGDPYTRFMNPEEFQAMQIDTSGELSGVGIQLAQDKDSKKLIVIAPIESTPAYKAGILAKDVIVKIDGKSTKGMEVDDAVKLIRGKPGTQVVLTIKRGNRNIDYPLVRAKIEIHPVRAEAENTAIGKIGYIRLNQFSAHAGDEMRTAMQTLEKQNVKGYILDLRSNPGGLLYASVDIGRLWLKDGKIVSTVDRQGEVEQQSANNQQLTDKPLVVLVDGGSASASEILSGALQDHKRAVIVGTKTFGKGLVQSVRSLGDGSGLAVTIAKYLTPNGRDINKHGIDPDVVIELTDAQRKALQKDREKIGTLADPQFAKAFEILKQQVAKGGSSTVQSAVN
jgi:carboxyl-terminal processing protease